MLFASVPAAKTINWRKKPPWQRLITSFANSWQFSMVTISVVVSVTYFLLLLLGCEFHGFFYPWPPENTEKMCNSLAYLCYCIKSLCSNSVTWSSTSRRWRERGPMSHRLSLLLEKKQLRMDDHRISISLGPTQQIYESATVHRREGKTRN